MYQGAKKVGKFDSSIDWGKWNKEIPENKALMKEYNAIEQAAKLDGTWMTDIDSNIFGDVERINLRDAIEFSETGLLRGKEANDSYKKIHKQLLTKLLKLKEQAVGTPEQFVQRRSKNYKKAFPNDPLKTYRGAVGTETYNGPLDGKVKNLGTVFTTGKNEAIHYAPKGDQGLLELLYNQSDNSLDFSAKGSGWNGLRTDLIPESNLKSSISTRNTTTDDIASRIEDLGIDYVNIRNIYDGVDMPLETIFNHRKGNYLKSAKGNNGMFDMTNPNIYKAIVPGAIGTAAASQMTGPVREDGQFKNGGWLDKFGMGGSLPGASGMMYARTSETSPEEPKKAQDGTVEYGTPEYKKAYEEGTFADVPNQLDEVVMYSGVDYEKYPYYNDLSAEQRKYFNDPGSIGRGVRRAAYTKRGLAEDTYDVVNPIMYGALGLAGGMAFAPQIATLGRAAVAPIGRALNYKPFGGPVSIGNVVDVGSAAYAGYATPEAYDKFKENPNFDTGTDLALTAMDLVPFSEILTGGKNIKNLYNKGKNLFTKTPTPAVSNTIDASIDPGIRKGLANLNDELGLVNTTSSQIRASEKFNKNWFNHPDVIKKTEQMLNQPSRVRADMSEVELLQDINMYNTMLDKTPNLPVKLQNRIKDNLKDLKAGLAKRNLETVQQKGRFTEVFDENNLNHQDMGIHYDENPRTLGLYKGGTNQASVHVKRIKEKAKDVGSVITHEDLHAITVGKAGYTDEATEILNSAVGKDQDWWLNKINTTKDQKTRQDLIDRLEYLARPQEIHARVHELRKAFNLKPGQEVSPSKIEAIMTKGLKGETPVDEDFFRMLGDKENFRKIFNKLPAFVPAAVGLGAASQNKNGGKTPKAQVGDKVASIASQMEVNEEDGGRPPLGVVDHIRALFDEEGLCRDNTCVQTVKDFYSKAGIEAIPKDVYNNREFLKNFKEYGFEEILDEKNLQPGDVLQYYYGPDSEDVKEDPSYLNFPYHMGVYVSPEEYIGDGDSKAPIQRKNMYTGTKDGKEYKKDPFRAFRYIKQNKNGSDVEKAQWGKLLKLAKKYGNKLLNFSKPAAKVDNTPALKYTDDLSYEELKDIRELNYKVQSKTDKQTRKLGKPHEAQEEYGEGWKYSDEVDFNNPEEVAAHRKRWIDSQKKGNFLYQNRSFPLFDETSDVYTDLTKYDLSSFIGNSVDRPFVERLGNRNLYEPKTSKIDFGDLLKNKNRNGGWLSKYENGGVIEDDRGQWAHPGKVTKINSNNITMKGVNYPVLGVSDTGDTKMMQPGVDNYKYDGNSVTEYPMAQEGAGVNKEGVKQYKWFKNYMRSPKYKERLKKEFPDYSDNQIGQEVKSRLENVMQTRVGFLPRSSDISTGVGGVQGVYNADEYPGAIMLRPEYSSSTSDVLFEPDNYLSGYNTIPLHEWSHAADDGGNRIPQSTTDLMLSKMKENSLDIPKDKYYYTRPTEYLGRMQPLRYLMEQEGLYDAGTQDFTKEDLEKAKQNKTIKNNVHFQDLMKNVNSDEDFIELMNTVASLNQKDNSRTMMAKQGESLVALDQLTNFTNYNTPQPGGWLDKY